MFKKQLGKTMEAYINDMVVKRKLPQDHFSNLRETFKMLRHYGMKFNPTKCALKVSSGKFLGYIVINRGIKPNPGKLEAILQTDKPETKKDIQVLIGHIATLSRFISQLIDRYKPFFHAFRRKQTDFWDLNSLKSS